MLFLELLVLKSQNHYDGEKDIGECDGGSEDGDNDCGEDDGQTN